MRFKRNMTAAFMAAAMIAASVTGQFSTLNVNAEESSIETSAETGSKTQILIDLNTTWNYYDWETDPVTSGDRTSWTTEDFDITGWKTSPSGTEAKFGSKNGIIGSADGYTPNILLTQYKEDGNDIEAFFFRTTVNVDASIISEEDLLKGQVIYDDAALVYLNGELIAEFDNMQHYDTYGTSEKFTANMQYGGHNGSTVAKTFEIAASKLKNGENIIAVELHQGRPTSSDSYFEMTSLVIEPFVTEQKAVSLAVGADETSRNITWYCNQSEAGTIQYAVKNGEAFPAEYSEIQAAVTETNDTDFYSNKAVLANLQADTEYVYRLVNGTAVSDVYSFKTTGTTDFNFLLAGDPQIGAGSIETDITGWEDTLNKAMAAFPNAAFLLSAGDQVNTASSETEYTGYLEHAALRSLPVATVIGNHDSGSDAYTEHFNNPNVTSYGATTAGTNYWYVYNNVLFMHINSNSGSVAEHKAFIEEAVAANTDVDWKVVSFHHSIYSAASHATQNDILTRRENYVPIFEENDIDVVLMGHDHVYVRSYIMDGMTPLVTDEVESSVTDPEGILYVTANSASGSKFYGITGEYEYAAVQSQEKTPNISNVEVTENSFKITTYRTNDMSVVDEFTINKSSKVLGETKTVEATGSEGVENKSASVAVSKVAEYNSGIVNEDGGSAEIIKYNSDNDMYYVVNGTSGTLDIVPRSTESTGIKLNLKRVLEEKYSNFSYGDMTSVDVSEVRDLIAVAVQAKGTNETGKVVFLNYNNEVVSVFEAGVQPDMLTFTADGSKVLVANEGEPRDGYGEETTDPEGSVSIIDLTNINGATVNTVTFKNWDAKREELAANGVIIKKGTLPSVDFEPEFITVNAAGTTAYVALQEANAIATLDLQTGTFTSIKSLGLKDHSLEENALDMAKDDTANIQTEANVYGIYMPDGITVYEVNGKTYLLTANEGDSREWGDYLNENEIKINGNKVVTFDVSDYDGLTAENENAIYLFGGRSFSIYDAETMEQVYDSGSDFETNTLKYFAEYFNCSNDKNSLDNRSGKKGPEAESIVVGEVNGKTYAFIGLERIGGVMIYDITDPSQAVFVNYINTRDFSENIKGDVSPEGLCFIPATESLSGNAELLAAHEVSGTVAIYQLTANAASEDGEQPEDDDQTDDDQTGDGSQTDGSQTEDESQTDDSQATNDNQNDGSKQDKGGKTKDDTTKTVKTGDNTNVFMWLVLITAAAAVLGGVLVVQKKRR